MANFLTKIFGTKADRDMKELKPLLNKTLEVYETIKDLSTDDLRHKTVEFREKIQTATATEEQRVKEIKDYLDANYDLPIEEKQDLYKESEKLEEKIYETTQHILIRRDKCQHIAVNPGRRSTLGQNFLRRLNRAAALLVLP